MLVIYFEPHTTGSCPECTDQNPAVAALSVVLAIVVLLLAVAILTIILLYTSEYDVKLLNVERICVFVLCMCFVCLCARVCVCVCVSVSCLMLIFDRNSVALIFHSMQ